MIPRRFRINMILHRRHPHPQWSFDLKISPRAKKVPGHPHHPGTQLQGRLFLLQLRCHGGNYRPASAFVDPVRIFTRAGVDSHQITLIDKQRHLNFVAIVDFCRFVDVGGGIPAHTGFGFHDFLLHEHR